MRKLQQIKTAKKNSSKGDKIKKEKISMLAKHVGRGNIRSLTKADEVIVENNIFKTHIMKSEIEEAAINRNKKYCTKACSRNAHEDKTCNKIQQDNVRDKTLK